ncbi:hypothetical protein EAG_11213 [Camponotus floridanus]|uniref:Uncharacterized protein n=1 Tax=Camponotus floridanus TaxID=104421 RepID=E2A0L9_CAMFO|nr:hypothetical protein EAG_11213 [Camponotus floridanus]
MAGSSGGCLRDRRQSRYLFACMKRFKEEFKNEKYIEEHKTDLSSCETSKFLEVRSLYCQELSENALILISHWQNEMSQHMDLSLKIWMTNRSRITSYRNELGARNVVTEFHNRSPWFRFPWLTARAIENNLVSKLTVFFDNRDIHVRPLAANVFDLPKRRLCPVEFKEDSFTFQQMFASNVAGKTVRCPSKSFEPTLSSHRHKCIANMRPFLMQETEAINFLSATVVFGSNERPSDILSPCRANVLSSHPPDPWVQRLKISKAAAASNRISKINSEKREQISLYLRES